jgi:major membrane immunogen (membrane-anchored lipoprotein)
MKKLLVPAIVGSLLLLAGCGEKTQVTVYKQGEYQGKPDTRPWDNERFKNDRAAWDKAIKARTVGQNEYARISGN